MVNTTLIDPNFDLVWSSSSAKRMLKYSFHSLFLFLMLCAQQGGKWRFRLLRLSPDGGLWKALNCLQNVPWRMWNILLFCAVLFSFNLTISLSLSPDCIRIDCNLSKCLLCLFTVSWFREHALWYDYMPLALFPDETKHNSYIYSAPQLSLFTVAVVLLTSIKDKNKNETSLWQVVLWLNIIGCFCSTLMQSTFYQFEWHIFSLLQHNNIIIKCNKIWHIVVCCAANEPIIHLPVTNLLT